MKKNYRGKVKSYDTSDNWAVLTQMHGSVLPKVLPWCIFNVLNVLMVRYLRDYQSLDLTFSDRGHTFMSIMVSFLIVTRSNIAYSRFMEGRDHLGVALKSCRELIQHAVTFTRYDTSTEAVKWRHCLARRTIVLLRAVVATLEFQTSGMHAWKAPELTREEKAKLKNMVGDSNDRALMVLAMWTRTTITSQREVLTEPIAITKEMLLYSFVSDFVTAFHEMLKLVTTPLPFPLVQMARIFLFIWIITLPWVLVDDIVHLPALILIVFVITYAFLGLEFVSIELDDPWGDDANDFDVLGMADVVFEDIFACLLDVDGQEAVDKFIAPMQNKIIKSRGLQYQNLSSSMAYGLADSLESLYLQKEDLV